MILIFWNTFACKIELSELLDSIEQPYAEQTKGNEKYTRYPFILSLQVDLHEHSQILA